jgi:hypothetical protein
VADEVLALEIPRELDRPELLGGVRRGGREKESSREREDELKAVIRHETPSMTARSGCEAALS